jgi:Zn-dependent membrane protease YugP
MEFFGFIMFDPRYFIIVGPAMLLALYAQMKVKGAYSRYSRVGTARGYSGAQAAARILERAGIGDVKIEMVKGWLSDHYDPARKVLRLSPDVYQGQSVASVGIAAHEAGHALQHASAYAPLQIRSMLVPISSFGSWLAWPMIFLGLILSLTPLAMVGLVLFTVLVAFQLITLPVEFNASARAKAALTDTGILVNPQESAGVSSVLNAAALTYVAATVTAVAELLYFVMLFSGGRSD